MVLYTSYSGPKYIFQLCNRKKLKFSFNTVFIIGTHYFTYFSNTFRKSFLSLSFLTCFFFFCTVLSIILPFPMVYCIKVTPIEVVYTCIHSSFCNLNGTYAGMVSQKGDMSNRVTGHTLALSGCKWIWNCWPWHRDSLWTLVGSGTTKVTTSDLMGAVLSELQVSLDSFTALTNTYTMPWWVIYQRPAACVDKCAQAHTHTWLAGGEIKLSPLNNLQQKNHWK